MALEFPGLRSRIQQALEVFLAMRRKQISNVDPALGPLADAVDTFVLGGGKRLRPAFAYWGYVGAGGQDREEVITAVASLELVQASALIHDDVMDGSATRRGKPAVHRLFRTIHLQGRWRGDPDQFGAASATLIGNLCLVWSDEMLRSSGLDLATLSRAFDVFDTMRTEATIGQYLDILAQSTGDSSISRARQVAQLKSAKYTVEHPLLFGAALAGADASMFTLYSEVGLPLGEAFQLRDDVLGVFGDPRITGKPAGDDLREGKRTYLIAVSFEQANGEDRKFLGKTFGQAGLADSDIGRIREVIVRCGALEQTEERISQLTRSALKALDASSIRPVAATALRKLAVATVERET